MKIAVLVSSLESGGAERVAVGLANAWAAAGDAVSLLATYPGATSSFYPVAPDVRLAFMGERPGGGRGASKLKRLLALREVLREIRPDVAVAFLTNVNVSAIAAAAGTGIPIIACERIDPQFPIPFGLAASRRALYRFADMVTVQTGELRERLGNRWLGCRRLRDVPNFVPDDLPLHAADASRTCNDAQIVAAVGRLTEQKQFGPLIEVFLHVAPPRWELRIFGEGPDRAALQRQIAAANATQRVRLMGAVTDLWSQLAGADAFVLASRYEGFPNALLEAMALGLPCASFDCPSGPREMTRGGRDALLVEAGNWDALGRALARLMDDQALRSQLGRTACESVRVRYSLPAVLARWDALFAELGVSREAATTQGPMLR